MSTDRAREGQPNDVDIPHTDVERILREAAERGVIVTDLTKQAPAECTTRARKRAWAAQQIQREAS